MTDPLTRLSRAVAEGIAAALPDLKSCAAGRATFTFEEIRRLSHRVPACVVAVEGLRQTEPVACGEVDVPVRLVASLLVKDQPGRDREEVVNALVADLVVLIPGTVWGLEDAHPAGPVTGEHRISGEVEKMGLMVAQVRWTQTLRLGADAYADPEATLGALVVRGPGGEAETLGGGDG